MLVSSIAWLSPNQRHRQVLTFKAGSVWIADAVPTGQPGEFAIVHQEEPTESLFERYDPRKSGIVLSIVRIQ
ncbi:MAG: hypothetical protein ACYCXT_11575 [Acidiferrobacteraceae bacterium]